MAEQYPVNQDIDEEGHWEALSKQNIAFTECLAELIDNAISGNIKDQSYLQAEDPEEYFRIQLTVHRRGSEVDCIVADSGSGIPPKTLADHVLRSGDRKNADGILNEHGYGLKNSLCVLTKNEGEPPFRILTRTKEEPDDDIQALFDGPFGGDQERYVVVDDYSDLWKEGAESLETNEHGTRVHFTTDYDKFREVYRTAQHLGSVIPGLRERLGVIYRHFLEKTQRNQIVIRWEDDVQDESGEETVVPVFPLFKEGTDPDGDPWERIDNIEVTDENGDVYSVKFRRGIVDWNETKNEFSPPEFLDVDENKSPFRIHYRKNTRTQGVDIVYRGRTLSTHLMQEIWDDVPTADGSFPPHNRFNSFVGELIIIDAPFETVNNKTGIHEESPLWKELKETLNKGIGNDEEKFHPIPFGRETEERNLRVRLQRSLENQAATDEVLPHEGHRGVEIDLIQRLESGDVYIYELKKSDAGPLDVYQLLMYWDAYKASKGDVSKAILVAKSLSANAKQFMERWNKRTDADGDPYNLEFKSLESQNLED